MSGRKGTSGNKASRFGKVGIDIEWSIKSCVNARFRCKNNAFLTDLVRSVDITH